MAPTKRRRARFFRLSSCSLGKSGGITASLKISFLIAYKVLA